MRKKKKQIEEMAKDIYATGVAIDGTDIAYGVHDNDDHFHRMAIKLCEAGYRKQNDTAKEILQPLYNVIMEHSECCVNLSEDIKFLMGEYGVNLEDKQ